MDYTWNPGEEPKSTNRPYRDRWMVWKVWHETEVPKDQRTGAGRRVDRTEVDGYEVSTVFLSSDHQYGEGPPLLFETMVFKDDLSGLYCDRYSTEAEARKGHSAVVAGILGCTLDLYEEK